MTTTSAASPVLVAPVRNRPPDTLVDRFRQVPVAAVGDALERLWVLAGDVRAMWPGARCAGSALPVYTRAGDNLAVHRALDIAQPGDVLVVNGQGDTTRALLGGLLAKRALNLGLAGIVVDGAVRDVDEIESVGLPVFARASTPAGPYKNGPAEVGLPVACGGVVCSPGDIVCGDADGVAVVPQARAAQVADGIAEILQHERDLARGWFGEG
jgi:RraA family protein